MTKKKQIEKEATVKERVIKYLNANDKLLGEHGLLLQLVIHFPNSRIPILSRIACWIIKMQGGYLDIQFQDNKNVNNHK